MNLKLVIGIILVTMVSLAGTAQAIVKVDDGDDTIVVSVTSTSSELQNKPVMMAEYIYSKSHTSHTMILL